MRTFFKIAGYSLLVFFILPQKIYAQLCEGSLGDPVVNITFGAGDNPGHSLGAATNYNYVTDGCPNDGYYTIANSIGNCFGDTWYSTQDHTPGDGSKGYMMVVNASYTPGDFFVKRVDGLCPNTTYEFAAWIYNLLASFACSGHGIKPNITFNIETPSGKVLQSYSTGDIPQNLGWKQYGFFFSTTVDINSVVLRMTNNAPGGCGNDICLDDITFRACGPLVSAAINGSGDSVDVCTGDTSIFTIHADVSAGYSDPVYQWQQSTNGGNSFTDINGATDSVYIRPATDTPARYLYRLAVSQRQNRNVSSCSIYSNVVLVGVNKYPVIDASTMGHCIGDTLFLKANEGFQFLWTGPSAFSSNEQNPFIPVATAADNGKYYVTSTSSKGCTSKDSTIATLTTPPVINAGNDQEICEGSSVQLQSTGSNYITSYQWLPSTGLSDPKIPNPIASPTETTLYILQAAHDVCIVPDSLLITVDKNPVANAGPDKIIIKGQSATLEGAAGGTDVDYLWTPDVNISGRTSLSPVVNPSTNQIYVLNVFSNKGCKTATDSMLVKVYQQLYIPNAFTPNGDGKNDTWYIETLLAYPGAEVQVFNRYGQKIFDNNGKYIWWDGTFKGEPQAPGAYVYLVDLKNNTQVIKGIVYIIR
ncbi:MAG: gliding motility-associated C-terminal domain-containing protein [Bacteroidota bacterium]|nr:gliding motility-associated C-terminal domain-containing protein [Bacteroidota bacterium]